MEPLNRFPTMMQEYLIAKVRAAEEAADARKRALRTKAEALAYQEELRKKVRRIFGPLPNRTPLNPRTTGVLERDGYRIEKVIFESRPGFPVTANLYLPDERRLPAPCVLAPCGHSLNGKAEEKYQSFCLGLVKKGYVVLIYDPVSQGERLQYPDGKGGSRYGVGVGEHIHAGNQQLLIGEFIGTWRVWDGIRALDYLLSRPEVDPTHIGLTGNSGGGTLTTLLVANDDRFTMAAPGCYVTTFRRNAENELPADSEQIPPGLLGSGMDMDDLLALQAPKPLILLTQEKDYFDQRGSLEVFARLQRLYRLLGAPDNVAMVTGPEGHGYGKPLREAMYGFFNRACGRRPDSKEPPLQAEPDEALYATETGQVADASPRTVFSFTKERAAELAARRKPLEGEELRRELTRLLALPKRSGPPEYRILRPWGKRGYPRPHAATYAVETEPNAWAILTMLSDEPFASRPPRGTEATLYVSHESADAELRDDVFARELVAHSERFFALDVRGVGDSQPNTCGENMVRHAYGSDYFYASFGILFSEPYIGRRTHDLLAVLDLLEDYGYTQVHLAGLGLGSLPALFAATLDERVTQVTLKHCLLSYQELAEDEDFAWPLSALLPNVLKTLDLPDCYRAVEGKHLRVIEALDAKRQPVG
jgi:cephalosporin-C deacetylase-like acetyl esterase